MRKLVFCIGLVLTIPASATIAQQRSNFNWTCSGTVTGGTLTCSQTFSTTGANDLIAVWTTWQSSVALTASVSDTLTSTQYPSAVGPTQQPTQVSGVPANAQIFYLKSTGIGGADTVKVTLTGPSGTSVPSFGMVMAEYSGLDTVNPLDSVSEAISNSGSPSGTLDSGTTSPANANLLVFGGGNSDYGSATTGVPWTTIQSNGGNITEYQILSGNNTLQRATASLSPSPVTGNWLMQMAVFRAASWTVAGGSSSTRAHGILDASQFPGSDIGAQTNNAYAACPLTGCHIRIPAGTYPFSTQINFDTNNKAVLLEGDPSATYLNFTGTGTAIIFQNGSTPGAGMRDLILTGPGSMTSTTGFQCGIRNGYFSNITIQQFGVGQLIGNGCYLDDFVEFFLLNNGVNGTDTLYYPACSGCQVGEGLRWIGGIFSFSTGGGPNTQSCVNIQGPSGTSLSFIGTSFDQCPWTVNSGGLMYINCEGCHFENPQGALTTTGAAGATPIDFIVAGSGCGFGCNINLIASDVLDDYAATARTELISIANGTIITLSGGNYRAANSNPFIAQVVNGVGNLAVYGAQLFQADRWQGASVLGLTCYNLGCYVTGSGVNIRAVNGSFFVNGSTYTVAGITALGASNYPGAQIMVSDSTTVTTEGQTCVGSSSHAALAIAIGGIWKCF